LVDELGPFKIRRCSFEEYFPIRDLIIRPHGLPKEKEFPGDRDPETLHYGLFERANIHAGCTLIKSTWEGRPARRLRGMGVSNELRGKGLGKKLWHFAENDIGQKNDCTLFWCDAREGAVAFYKKLNWIVVSNIYEVPGIGPHYKMVRNLLNPELD